MKIALLFEGRKKLFLDQYNKYLWFILKVISLA